MRHAILILLVGIAGCSQPKSGESNQQLVAKDKLCAAITTQAACTADVADGCNWVELPVSQIACPPNDPCPIQTTGICEGSADGDQCVLADQCARIDDQATCAAHADCGWVPGICAEPAIACAPGANCPPPPPCPPFVCQPVNPCDGLDANSCTANPDCMLQDVQNCTVPPPCPAYSCPANEPNCPPPIGYNCPPAQPPSCSSSVTCVHTPVVCGGSGGGVSGNGDGPPGSTGGSPGSPPTPSNG
jgi:hypothetical protein